MIRLGVVMLAEIWWRLRVEPKGRRREGEVEVRRGLRDGARAGVDADKRVKLKDGAGRVRER